MNHIEAKKRLQEMKRQSECIFENPTIFYSPKDMAVGLGNIGAGIEALDIAISALEMTHADKWIPAERPPKENADVLVTCISVYTRDKYIEKARLNPDEGWIVSEWPAEYIKPKVVAWQPLPEPYKEEIK